MSASTEHIDAEFKETGSALATRSAGQVTTWVPTFAVAVDEAIERKREKRRFFLEVMEEGLHYGVIPGTGDKPTLFKAGAEMLLSNMGLNPVGANATPPIVDVTGADHGGEPYIRYDRTCRIYRQVGPHVEDRMLVAELGGVCSSWETKYRYRNDKLKCAECGKPTIIKAKDFTNQGRDLGWVCWKKEGKSDGCGTQYPPGDARIAKQVVGKIPNPDVAELENTILKMADKRALVAATLIATGCSDIFTQDVEDAHGAGDPPDEPQRAERAATSPQDDAARKDALDTVARGWEALGLTTPAQYADRVGKVADPETPWDELSLLELQRLGKVLAREYRESQRAPGNGLDTAAYAASGDRDGGERDTRPDPVQCTECTGLDGQHLDDDLGPCVNDQSENALRIRAGEASAERYPEARQETLL